MKSKDIEIGKCYTDKSNSSVRKVIFIKENLIKYIMIESRYKSTIGKENSWDLKRFAGWANSICNETDKINKVDYKQFFNKPKVGTILRFKDEFSLEDFFKLDEIDSNDIQNYNLDDFKQAKIGKFSSPKNNEYEILIKSKDGYYYSFPSSKEELEKYFDIL